MIYLQTLYETLDKEEKEDKFGTTCADAAFVVKVSWKLKGYNSRRSE